MAAPSKAQLLTDVHSLLKKRYKLEPRTTRLTVLEAVVYGICHEGTTREQANQALARFKDDFFDWNEVRVSSLEEIQGVLAGLSDPEGRAFRIRRFLRQLFDKTYGFNLDHLLKKPLKESIKALQEFEALQSDYVLATVIQQALGGHAIPIDVPFRRTMERLGVVEEGVDNAALRSALERAIPKNRGAEFVDLIEELSHGTCLEENPDCPHCDLRKLCPTGQTRLASDRVNAKSAARAKSTNDGQKALESKPTNAPPSKSSSAKPSSSKPKGKSSRSK